ncbi:hypothetical protein [Microtetraspora malaysiensis]|uniref:hypothetical protein n=1 Tax=Microtetraspora malaysiensis TaxID=161358 RepID=UPI003D8FEBCA
MTDVLRSSVLGLAAMTLALGLSACGGDGGGGGIDKAALVAKIKASDPDLKGIPEKTLACLADAVIKYGDQGSVQGFLDGSVASVDDIKGLGKENKEAEAAGQKCVE